MRGWLVRVCAIDNHETNFNKNDMFMHIVASACAVSERMRASVSVYFVWWQMASTFNPYCSNIHCFCCGYCQLYCLARFIHCTRLRILFPVYESHLIRAMPRLLLITSSSTHSHTNMNLQLMHLHSSVGPSKMRSVHASVYIFTLSQLIGV